MKETTRIITAQITEIIRHEDDIETPSKEMAAARLKAVLGADDVVIESVQDFTQDLGVDEKLREIADMLNGIEYGDDDKLKEIAEAAKESGYVIVSGESDDLMEFCGAIYDEADCYEGGTVYFDKSGVLPGVDSGRNAIEAFRCDKTVDGQDASWVYKTDIPHEKFCMVEDGEVYCEGIVFSIKDVK